MCENTTFRKLYFLLRKVWLFLWMFNHLHNLNRKTVDYYISQGSPNQPFRNTPSYLGIANIATLTSAKIHGPVLQWCLAAAKSMISVPMTAYKSRLTEELWSRTRTQLVTLNSQRLASMWGALAADQSLLDLFLCLFVYWRIQPPKMDIDVRLHFPPWLFYPLLQTLGKITRIENP